MSEGRYASDKPKECRYCYFWEGKKKGCQLGEEHCYYILPPREEAKKTGPCDGCPYGVIHPCIGYCLREIQQRREAVK